MSRFIIKDSYVRNQNFKQAVEKILGEGWSVFRDNDQWIVELSGTTFPYEFYTKINLFKIASSKSIESLVDALGVSEIKSEHDMWHSAANQGKPRIDHWEAYGLLSDLYADSSIFFVQSRSGLQKEKLSSICNLVEDLEIKNGISYRKNLMPFLTLYSFIKNTFLMSEKMVTPNSSLPIENFGGTLPIGPDLGTYIDSFLIFAPYTFSLSLNRMTSGIFLIPGKELITPYISYSGWSDIFSSSPISSIDSTVFNLFDGLIPSKIFLRRYVLNLIDRMNKFLAWMYNPKTCSIVDEYNAEIGLQLHGSINSLFKSFQFCAKRLSSEERLVHFFNTLDKLSNISVNMKYRRQPQVLNLRLNAEETKSFIKLLSSGFEKEVISILANSGFGKKLTPSMIKSFKKSCEAVDESLKAFEKPPEEVLRTLRNMSHGAFLNKNDFINTFRSGRLELSNHLIAKGYFLMLAFISNPEVFIEKLCVSEK